MALIGRIIPGVLFLMVGAGWTPILAQRGAAGGGLGLYGFGPRLGENVQLALDNRDHLGLSQEQVARLQELQAGIQQDVTPLQTEIDGLRTGILSGEVNRADGLVALQALRAEYDEIAAPYRTGVTAILTADQHAELQGILWSTRPVSGTGWAATSGGGYGLGVGRGVYGGRGLGRGVGRGAGAWGGRGLRSGARSFRGRGAGLGVRWWWDGQ